MGLFRYEYLGPEVLAGFDTYKYSCRDTSPLSNYVMHPFWNQAVKLCPLWVAPNLLTLVGFICCIGHWGLLAITDYDFRSGTAPPEVSGTSAPAGVPVPGVIWLCVAILLFLSHTLDGIDGKQARRTQSSTPLGELFDHGLDSWATIFITGAIYSVFGRNDDGFSISVFRMFCLHWNIYFCFLLSHWEKYNTGILNLPWGYDLSMVSSFILYLVTAAGGQQMWSSLLPGDIPPGPVFEAATYVGNVGMSLPVVLWNLRVAYRDGTGKNRTFLEAIRPLVATTVACVLCFIWVLNSQNDVLEKDPRCVFLLTGTIFANICCKLIICQMSNTRSELLSFILAPLALATAFVTLVPGLSPKSELAVLYGLTFFVIVAHCHYGTCVVLQMCDHLHIRPFHIRYPGSSSSSTNSSAGYQPLSTEEDQEPPV